jgi:2-amino-4-hydroxy-6-hydroxymethyldihydropteridine diphosphokinase
METGFSLGSNLGDRLAHLAEAAQRLADVPDTRLVARSPVYETEPVDVRPEHHELKFLNAVVIVESPLDARAWLAVIRATESALGRRRTSDRNAPRPIDVDLLYSGADCIDDAGLVVPHPRWAERRFVVQPLADVRPELILPGRRETVAAVLRALPPGEGVAVFARQW